MTAHVGSNPTMHVSGSLASLQQVNNSNGKEVTKLATAIRIKRRRNELRGGHSVRCHKYMQDPFSKFDRACTCDKKNTAPKPVKRTKPSKGDK